MYIVLRDCNIKLKTMLSMKFICAITEADRHEHLFDVQIKTPIDRIEVCNQGIILSAPTGVSQDCPISWFYKLELI